VDKLKEEKGRQDYQRALTRKLQENKRGIDEVEEEEDIDKEWRKIEKAIKESAEETIGERKNARNEEWFDEECANFIEEKNKARKKMIERETRSNCEK
jgi:hypothetical protein